MCATEKKSCQKIADQLTRIGIPCSSAAIDHPGKRNRRTAPIWRPSHVRNMIANPTYMGQHVFGKRTKNPNRKKIVREVPAIVSKEVWQAAQEVRRSNRIISKRNTREPYLLRGLIKCGLCGLTFSGMRGRPPQRDHYYHCNGRQFARALYGNLGKKCPAKGLNGDYVERLVWADIEAFLRNPGETLDKLRERISMQDGDRQRREQELDGLQVRLAEKAAERDRMLGLYRRGRIDEATLDQHLDMIDAEAAGLQAEIEMATKVLSAGDRAAQLRSAEELLGTLRKRLDGPIAPELKRRIVQALVEKIQADTAERWGVPQSELTIFYRFSQPGEAVALVLPRPMRLTSSTRLPEKLETVGDHLLRRRLGLKLLQRQVAGQLGVNVSSLRNWEANRSKPTVEFMPAIIRFLGYNPLPPGTTWAERLVSCRTAMGVTQGEAAHRIGIDQGTLARWERGEREPAGAFLSRVQRFLGREAVPEPKSSVA
jgi:transcriptional regulator with XRE-family HTH domain